MSEPMSDERLAELAYLANKHGELTVWQAGELIREVDRLRATLEAEQVAHLKATQLVGHYFRVLQGVGKACPECEAGK